MRRTPRRSDDPPDDTDPLEPLYDAVYAAFEKAGVAEPADELVKLLVVVASDCWDLGYKAGMRDEQMAMAHTSYRDY